jgi:hypothetical protein
MSDLRKMRRGSETVWAVVVPLDHRFGAGNLEDGRTEGNLEEGRTEGTLEDERTEGNLEEGRTDGRNEIRTDGRKVGDLEE